MESDDEGLRARQHEVQRLLGNCLLRLQKYEIQLKAILAQHEIAGSIASIDEAQAERTASVYRKTLGTLVGQLLDSFLVVDGHQGTPGTSDDIPYVAFRMQVALSFDDFVQTENDIRELVALRNDFVHHFLEHHDLSSLAGCNGAVQALVATSARIAQAGVGLQTWAKDLEHARQFTSEVFASAAVQDYIATGRIPWPITGIVQALRDAEVYLAVDGWTAVANAGRWISARYPEELPEGYGCRSWRQVIHEAGLFELTYR